MFPTLCKVFVKDVSDENDKIQACKSLEQAVSLRNVLVKRTVGHWIFKKTIYSDSNFKLHELLVKGQQITEDLKEETDEFDWNKILRFKLEGKLRALYSKFEAGANYDVNIKALLGPIRRKSLSATQILDLFSQRQIDIKHNFIKEIKEKKLSLCLVGKIYQVKDKCDVVKATGSTGDLDVTMFPWINAGAKIDNQDLTGVTLDPNTPVAFQPWDISIEKSSGQVKLCLLPGENPGFFENESGIISKKDNPTGRTELENITKDLDDLKTLPEIVRKAIKMLYSDISFEDLTDIKPKMKILEVWTNVTPDKKEKLCKDIKNEQVKNFLIVLCNLGLSRKEKKYQSLITLFDATTCITKDLFLIVQAMEQKNADEFLSLFQTTLIGEIILTFEEVSKWKTQGMAKLLVEQLCSKVNGETIGQIDEKSFSLYLKALFIILYVLYKVLFF